MCGINGFNSKNENLIQEMNRLTAHRGPDGTGFFVDENVSLGHNRLSIIDLSKKANQPMRNKDDNLIITYNGELYNFKDLKKELHPYPFQTESDTEVVLAAFQKWGPQCLERFNGIFAFAIWDKTKQELFLARDHSGIKPLYYFHTDETFIFSSEIKALLAHPIPRVLSKKALAHYLNILYVPEPLTMFKGIKKLPPATYALVKNNNVVITPYWDAKKLAPELAPEQVQELAPEQLLEEKVAKSVEEQLVSDKPLGVYLSGGIDSSTILECMSRIRESIDTFSVGFELTKEEQREKFNADFLLARKTAKTYNTNHHEVLLRSGDVLPSLEKAVHHLDEPIANPTIIPQIVLAQFAKQYVDVVLGGDGGDELFGGYERYRLSYITTLYQKLPHFVRSLLNKHPRLKKLNTKAGIDQFRLFMFQEEKTIERILKDSSIKKESAYDFFDNHYFKNYSKETPAPAMLMDVDRQSWLVDEALMRTDKMSMSAGLEVRVPILAKELVEYANTIPLNKKVGISNTKIILKKAFRKKLPQFLFNQPKRGWFSPGAKWLRHEDINAYAKKVLSSEYYGETAPLFNWKEIEKILDDHCSKKEYNANIIWALIIFQMWAKEYKVKP